MNRIKILLVCALITFILLFNIISFINKQILLEAEMNRKDVVNNLKNYVELPDEEAVEALPTPIEPKENRFERIQKKLNEYKTEFGKHPQDQFLSKIKHLESSGGTNIDHKTMESGLHEGTAAIGRWGQMPKSVKQIATSLANPESLLTKAMGTGFDDPEVRELAGLPDEEITERLLSNPKLEKRVARYMATRLDQMEGDELDKAFRWNMGSNIPKANIDPEKRLENSYIRKFLKLDNSDSE